MMENVYGIDVTNGYRENKSVENTKKDFGRCYDDIRKDDPMGRDNLLTSLDNVMETCFRTGEELGISSSIEFPPKVPTMQDFIVDGSLYERLLEPVEIIGPERVRLESLIKQVCYHVLLVGFNRGLSRGAAEIRRIKAAPYN